MRARAAVAAMFSTAWVALWACAETNPASAPGDAGTETGTPAEEDGATLDADGGEDADAAPAMCTADDICHTVLPANEDLRDVWGDGQGVVWAVSRQGHVLRWNGTAWTIQHSEAGALGAIWGSSPTDIWIGGARGLFHGQGASSDTITWTHVTVNGLDGIPIVSIWGTGPSDIWAVGGFADTTKTPHLYDGRAMHYDGTSFEIEPVRRAPAVFTKVWGTSAEDVWIAGYDLELFPAVSGTGVALRFDPAGAPGARFTELTLPKAVSSGRELDLARVLGGGAIAGMPILLAESDGSHLYFVGSPGADGGFDWKQERFAVHPSLALRAVWGTSTSDLWLAGDFGRLRHWDGSTWSLPRTVITQVPLTNAFHAIWGKGDDVWFVGDEIALHKRPAQN